MVVIDVDLKVTFFCRFTECAQDHGNSHMLLGRSWGGRDRIIYIDTPRSLTYTVAPEKRRL